jgi:hypothetical protein
MKHCSEENITIKSSISILLLFKLHPKLFLHDKCQQIFIEIMPYINNSFDILTDVLEMIELNPYHNVTLHKEIVNIYSSINLKHIASKIHPTINCCNLGKILGILAKYRINNDTFNVNWILDMDESIVLTYIMYYPSIIKHIIPCKKKVLDKCYYASKNITELLIRNEWIDTKTTKLNLYMICNWLNIIISSNDSIIINKWIEYRKNNIIYTNDITYKYIWISSLSIPTISKIYNNMLNNIFQGDLDCKSQWNHIIMILKHYESTNDRKYINKLLSVRIINISIDFNPDIDELLLFMKYFYHNIITWIMYHIYRRNLYIIKKLQIICKIPHYRNSIIKNILTNISDKSEFIKMNILYMLDQVKPASEVKPASLQRPY